MDDFVVLYLQAINRYSVNQWGVEGDEFIVFNCDTFFSAMKVCVLMGKVRDYRIDGYYCFGELEHARKGIDEAIIANCHIVARASFKPPIAIAA